jgi:superfamily II DNA or RNA helicase
MSGKPLGDTFDDLIIGPAMRFLIDSGFLSDFDYLAPDTVSMEGVGQRNGDFIEAESLARVDNRAVIGSAVDHYRQHSDHLPAIAACVSIDHAIHVAKEFCDAGYRFRAVHSRMSEDEIYRSIRELGDGTIDGLTNCDLIGEGTDIPVVTTLIGLRPTASETIHLQYCGRVLRRCAGKDRAIILDHVGNYTRHGFPDDPREWSLDDVGAKIPDNSKYKTCPNCYHANVPISARECPFCGFLMKETRDPGMRIPEQRDGVLVDVRGQRKQEIILKIARKARSLREAVLVAAADGVAEPEAEYIWNVVLRNKTA